MEFYVGTSGQGLITIFIGLMLSNYPEKYKIEKKIIAYQEYLKQSIGLEKSDEPPLIYRYYLKIYLLYI